MGIDGGATKPRIKLLPGSSGDGVTERQAKIDKCIVKTMQLALEINYVTSESTVQNIRNMY